ncbi:MAG TPA: cytochrome c oxidase subunit 3 [Candidatus Didemnitutus sp.]|jgi:cytochrome c oxidase subunit 3
MNANHPAIPVPYVDAAQRARAGQLGMWTFLATEVLFFGGLITSYVVMRVTYPAAFAAGSRHLSFAIGTTNTLVLLTSSLTMVWAVALAGAARRRAAIACLVATGILGALFLALKSSEYHDKFVEHLVPGNAFRLPAGDPPALQIFLFLYFALTGLHALHMLVGIALVGWMVVRLGRTPAPPPDNAPELVGLYWHFVDCVWVFLYPLLYLVTPS